MVLQQLLQLMRLLTVRLGDDCLVIVALLQPIMMKFGSLDSSRKVTLTCVNISQINFVQYSMYTFIFFKNFQTWPDKSSLGIFSGKYNSLDSRQDPEAPRVPTVSQVPHFALSVEMPSQVQAPWKPNGSSFCFSLPESLCSCYSWQCK